MVESGIGVFLTCPYVGIHNVGGNFTLCLVGQLLPCIDVIGHHLRWLRFLHTFLQEAVGNNHGCVLTTDIQYSLRRTTLRTEIVEFIGRNTRDEHMAFPLHDIVAKSNGHRDFRLGSLTQRNTDSVAIAVAQQGTDAHSRLDTSVFPFASLSHAQVKWKLHPLFLHLIYQQANGANHNDCVAGLDGNDDIAEMLLHADTQELQTRLHHTFGCIAIARHDAVRQ